MLPRGSGGMVSFGLKGDNPGPLGQAMIDATVLATHCANIGVSVLATFLVIPLTWTHPQDVRTLVVCPAKTVQRQLSKEHLLQSGTPDDLIRVSCGIEDPDEIIAGEPNAELRRARVTFRFPRLRSGHRGCH